MGNVQAEAVTYFSELCFSVRVDGEDWGQWETCEGFDEIEVEVLDGSGGESNVVLNQQPGKVKFPPLVLARTVSSDTRPREWSQEVVADGGVGGDPSPGFKKVVSISQLDNTRKTKLRTWTCYESWPSKYSGGKFDASGGKLRKETLTLTYRYSEPSEA